jgi:hypothetical protein
MFRLREPERSRVRATLICHGSANRVTQVWVRICTGQAERMEWQKCCVSAALRSKSCCLDRRVLLSDDKFLHTRNRSDSLHAEGFSVVSRKLETLRGSGSLKWILLIAMKSSRTFSRVNMELRSNSSESIFASNINVDVILDVEIVSRALYCVSVLKTAHKLIRLDCNQLLLKFQMSLFFPEDGVGQTEAWMPAYVTILRIPQMIWVWRATVEWYWQGKTEELGEKRVPESLCPPQIPHGLTWMRTRASAVRDRRLKTWAMARHSNIT